jgi:hypothetical protein
MVYLPAGQGRTVIRNEDAIHAGVHCRVYVLDRLYTLEHDKSVPVLTQECQVGPRVELPELTS